MITLSQEELLRLLEEAFCEGFSEGYDGGWIWGDYTSAWKQSDTLREIKEKLEAKE